MTDKGNKTHEQVITPWDVQGEVVDGVEKGINYDKLINKFGTKPITQDLLRRFEQVTKRKPHHLIRRGIFFSHRNMEVILDLAEQKKPFFLYTGRGPSNESMHLGHCVPFIISQYLQEIFDVPLVIQLTDDEKYVFKEKLSLADCQRFAYENAKDIAAFGFNPDKTFIFANTEYYGYFFETILKVQKSINLNQANSVFGFDETSNLGKITYPAAEIAACYAECFQHIFAHYDEPISEIPCLIPCAIDQDPYFRLARDIAHRIPAPKPTSLYCKFFPALQGPQSKMSSSIDNTAIFLSDDTNAVQAKIKKYAFSGGQQDLKTHRELGGNPDVDVPYQYLTYFLEDDDELAHLASTYRAGELLTGDLKKRCSTVISEFLLKFQAARAQITDEYLARMTTLPPFPKKVFKF